MAKHYRTMSPTKFKRIRKKLGLDEAELSVKLRLGGAQCGRTVKLWERGLREISGPVSLCMEQFEREHDAA